MARAAEGAVNKNRLLKVIASVPASGVIRLAKTFGFGSAERLGDRGLFLTRADGDELFIPTTEKLRDYPNAVLDILQILRPKRLTMEDMVTMLVLPPCDVYRHRYSDEISKFGSFPLAEFPGAASALYDMFRFTAAGVRTARRSYTKLPPDADAFAHGCQVGQTELKSYVIKIFCPLDPTNEQHVQDDVEPFGRMVVMACLENIEFLNRDESVFSEDVLPAALNRNVLSAVSRLRPMMFGATGEASAWLNPTHLASDSASDLEPIPISAATYNHAQILERRLQPTVDDEPLNARGYIVDLHKDRPTTRRTLSHEVTMDIKEEGGWRKLRLNLLPQQYRNAVRWHDLESQVVVRGKVDRSRVPWRTIEIDEFINLDKGQTFLFIDDEEPAPPAPGAEQPD